MQWAVLRNQLLHLPLIITKKKKTQPTGAHSGNQADGDKWKIYFMSFWTM
jgi:hypothetical protein